MNTDIVSYYKDRAKEYEKIHSKPERQSDLQQAKKILQQCFSGKFLKLHAEQVIGLNGLLKLQKQFWPQILKIPEAKNPR